ncbi:hypothetical protein KK083_04090 [Fulvivirgaceae bacterium PWU4]|uniref:Uncharacterized protein n=1 Tax=Chryseosolibacter histidini TaxID=2782349 RepID=A0AAP2DLD3_9BACT|nr:hypothetical protein [Chryseosolibacter histidini]MBT1696044.1 hypothetical protein [Chryseosolibacter histidini]
MRQKRVRLEILDGIIHYSLAIYVALPVLILGLYFTFAKLGLFGVNSSINEMIFIIPALTLAPISIIIYLIQRDKLKFQFIRTSVDKEAFRDWVTDVVREYKWSIRSFKDNTFIIKTNPGFVNQSWGQHITIMFVEGGVLVNSIFDPNKGSWIITFGSNRRNIDEIKKLLVAKTREIEIYKSGV